MRLLFYLMVCCLPVAIQAQTTETMDDTYDRPASGQVVLDLKFAGIITVEQTDRSDVLIRKTITYRTEKDRDLLVETVEEGERLRYTMSYRQRGKNYNTQECWDCDRAGCQCFKIDYTILLPSGISLDVESISGDIDIPAYDGALRAKTISGFVDLGLPARASANVFIKTVTGEIYTDFDDLTLTDDSNPYSKKVDTTLGNGGKAIRLESVSGNIYVRKQAL